MGDRFGSNDSLYDLTRILSMASSQAAISGTATGGILPSDIALTDAHILVGNASNVGADVAMSGDATIANTGALTLATVNANVGTFGSATQAPQLTVNAKGLITGVSNVTISGVTPAAHDIAGALHTTSGRTAGQVLQATGATTFGWSTNTLTISGNSTINGSLVGNITGGGTLATGGFTGTIPETMTFAGRNVANTFTAVQTITAPNSTALTGGFIFTQTKTGTAGGVYKFVDLTGTIDLPSDAGGAQDFYLMNAIIQTAADATVYSSANLRSFYLSPQHNGTSTISTAVGAFVDIYNNSTGTIATAMGYYSRIRNAGSGLGKITTARNFWASNMTNSATTADNQYAFYADSLTTATNNYLLYGAGLGRVRVGDDVSIVGGADRTQLTVTGFSTQTNTLAQLTRNDGNTSAVVTMLTATVNTTGTAANGFGGAIALNLESSTTADQAAAAIKWLWSTATHASRKAKMQFTTYDTAERIGLALEADGAAQDVYFEGGAGSGFPYGGCYGNDIGWTQASAAQNTWYIVSDTDMTDSSGGLNLVTHDGSGKLTVAKAGRYRITYGATVGCSVANKLIQTTLAVNGTAINDGIQHVVMNATSNMVVASTAILALAANDFVEFNIRTTDTGTPDISVEHLNITLVQIGG